MTGSSPRRPASTLIAGLDPGRCKCGLVLADLERQRIVEAAILPPEDSRALLLRWRDAGVTDVVLGNGTGSSSWRSVLSQLHLKPTLVDERGSTLAARDRYWQLFAPGRWLRLLPAGLRLPPRDLDYVVAQLLLERHTGLQLQRDTADVLGPAAQSG
jgi:hypothetical protein